MLIKRERKSRILAPLDKMYVDNLTFINRSVLLTLFHFKCEIDVKIAVKSYKVFFERGREDAPAIRTSGRIAQLNILFLWPAEATGFLSFCDTIEKMYFSSYYEMTAIKTLLIPRNVTKKNTKIIFFPNLKKKFEQIDIYKTQGCFFVNF